MVRHPPPRRKAGGHFTKEQDMTDAFRRAKRALLRKPTPWELRDGITPFALACRTGCTDSEAWRAMHEAEREGRMVERNHRFYFVEQA